MNSTDFVVTGLGVVAPEPATGVRATSWTERWTERVVLMAPTAAPCQGTGLPAVRLRGLFSGATAADATGAPYGTGTQLIDLARTGLATTGVPAQRTTSTTPGDLPPEDPLS
ncbi:MULTISPECIES: hypothetical protein [unclassified Modestobacter]